MYVLRGFQAVPLDCLLRGGVRRRLKDVATLFDALHESGVDSGSQVTMAECLYIYVDSGSQVTMGEYLYIYRNVAKHTTFLQADSTQYTSAPVQQYS